MKSCSASVSIHYENSNENYLAVITGDTALPVMLQNVIKVVLRFVPEEKILMYCNHVVRLHALQYGFKFVDLQFSQWTLSKI